MSNMHGWKRKGTNHVFNALNAKPSLTLTLSLSSTTFFVLTCPTWNTRQSELEISSHILHLLSRHAYISISKSAHMVISN
jgi:hypothetical protein